MTKDEMVELVQAGLGFRKDLDSYIGTVMNIVQKSVLEGDPALPWFLVSNDIPATLESGDYIAPLPEYFIRELDYGTMRMYAEDTPDDIFFLRKIPQDPGPAHEQPPGRPQGYSLFGRSLSFDRPADKRYIVYTAGYRRADLLVDGANCNVWSEFAGEWFVAETLYYISRSLRDAGLAQQANNDRQRARERVMLQSAARESAAMDLTGRVLRASRER